MPYARLRPMNGKQFRTRLLANNRWADFDRIHFTVMAIESGAKKLSISGRAMHDRLKAQGLIHSRLIGRYDDLHTQSLVWVTDDIVETLKNWEASA